MKMRIRNVLLALLIILGAFLRFYDLDWGKGYFFHPDEYKIARSVRQMKFPNQMNPRLFSYGNFITYLIFFERTLLGLVKESWGEISPFLVGRFNSALFSTLTIFVVYKLTREIFRDDFTGLFAGALISFMPGLIQQAHFATPESILIFWVFSALCFGFRWWNSRSNVYLYLSACCLGLGTATKIVALTFSPVFAVLIFLRGVDFKEKSIEFFRIAKRGALFLAVVLVTFVTVTPYSVLAWEDWLGEIQYEAGIGRGKPLVFYTRQFIDTTSVVFQFKKILPYALGPVLLVAVIGFCLLLGKVVKSLLYCHSELDLESGKSGSFRSFIRSGSVLEVALLFSFLIYFIPSSFLFAKWTRFTSPAFPFFAIFAAYAFFVILRRESSTRLGEALRCTSPKAMLALAKRFGEARSDGARSTADEESLAEQGSLLTSVDSSPHRGLGVQNDCGIRKLLVISCWLSITVYSFMFFSIYLQPDVRIQATDWLNGNLPRDSFILTEGGNMLDVPLRGPLQKKSFDFYHLEKNENLQAKLPRYLEKSDYFVIQSRRIYFNHQRLPERFPITDRFYDRLFSGALGFRKIKEFTAYPSLDLGFWELQIPDEGAEETWSVFDHPRIRVYEKQPGLGLKEYQRLLQPVELDS